VTTRVLNAIDPETAQRIRDRIAGKPLRVEPAKPKRVQPVKCYASQFHKFDPAKNTHTVQLPIAFNRATYNTSRAPWYLKEKAVKEIRETVWLALGAYLPNFDGARVLRMEFVRIAINKMDTKDNLPAAFKAVVDATCSFLVWGSDAPSHVRAIGSADDKLEQRGVTWTYRQMQCESNPRLYAIRIILHCTPLTTE
jgi:hypothetical protein